MRELYTLELMQLVEELQSLEGSYIDQFYEIERNKFRFKITSKGMKANLQALMPYSLNRTTTIEIKEEATNFTMAARKRISGVKIKRIEQFNNDRIIKIKTEKAEEEMNLIFEMFGRGNFIITDKSMKILLAYQLHIFKDRAVRPGSTYAHPKNSSINPFDKSAIEGLLKEAGSKDESAGILPYLAKQLGIGKMYVEEALARAKMESTAKLSELNEKKSQLLLEKILEIIKECTDKPEFVLYKKEGIPFDFSICSITKYSSLERQKFDSLESCLDSIYQDVQLTKEGTNEDEEATKASIEKQKQLLVDIDNEISENKRQGDYIMNNMHQINEMINLAKSRRNPTKEELQQNSIHIEILNVNTKTKIIKIKTKDSENNA